MVSATTSASASLRFAQPTDIMRLGTVAYAAFASTNDFNWFRPHHQKFPEDTLASLRRSFATSIHSEGSIVMVVEDTYKYTEQDAANIPQDGAFQRINREKVVVGFIVWELDASSRRWGEYRLQMRGNPRDVPIIPFSDDRDLDQNHIAAFKWEENMLKIKHLGDCATSLGLLGIHPAYQRRGHARTLVQWGIDLANEDGTQLGLSATSDAVPVYKALGWEHMEEFKLDGDEISPAGNEAHIMRYTPTITNPTISRL